MDENKTILEALSEAEMVLFYAKDPQLAPEKKEIHEQLKQILERWYFLTGETIS